MSHRSSRNRIELSQLSQEFCMQLMMSISWVDLWSELFMSFEGKKSSGQGDALFLSTDIHTQDRLD